MNQQPVHPPLPLGLGSYVTLTGVAGAVAAFIIAWIETGMNGATASLGVAAMVAIVTWYAGRSAQAKTAIEVAGAALGEVGIAFDPDGDVIDEAPEEELDFKGPVDEPTA